MSKTRKFNRTSHQIKEEQINFLLEDIKGNLEEYKRGLELKKKFFFDAKKILVSAKNSYDKTEDENKELKMYIQNQQRQQVQFLEDQKTYYDKRPSKNIKK